MPVLPALSGLCLHDAPIDWLAAMPSLPALADLDLSGYTPLATLEGMPALPALKQLDVSGTGSRAGGCRALPALRSPEPAGDAARVAGGPAAAAGAAEPCR